MGRSNGSAGPDVEAARQPGTDLRSEVLETQLVEKELVIDRLTSAFRISQSDEERTRIPPELRERVRERFSARGLADLAERV